MKFAAFFFVVVAAFGTGCSENRYDMFNPYNGCPQRTCIINEVCTQADIDNTYDSDMTCFKAQQRLGDNPSVYLVLENECHKKMDVCKCGNDSTEYKVVVMKFCRNIYNQLFVKEHGSDLDEETIRGLLTM